MQAATDAAAAAAGNRIRPWPVGRCSSAWSGPRGRPGACAGTGTGSSRRLEIPGAPRTRARGAVARCSPALSAQRFQARSRLASESPDAAQLRVAVALAPETGRRCYRRANAAVERRREARRRAWRKPGRCVALPPTRQRPACPGGLSRLGPGRRNAAPIHLNPRAAWRRYRRRSHGAAPK